MLVKLHRLKAKPARELSSNKPNTTSGTSSCPSRLDEPPPPSLCRVTRVSAKKQEAVLLEKILGPDDAVDGLGRRVSYGAPWKRLLGGLGLALVAFGQPLQSKGSQHTVTPGIAAACPRPETQHITLT